MSARRFPPYGRKVSAILRSPVSLARYSGCTATRPSIWLATGGDAWDWTLCRPLHLAVVLPDGDDPAAYRWDFLAGHDPILLTGEAVDDPGRRREIAAALFRDGVRRVLSGRVLMVPETISVAA